VTCDAEKVTAFVDGALGAADREALELHLRECEPCRGQAEFERDLRRRLAALPRAPLPDALEARVRAVLKPARRPSAVWRVLMPAAAVLALVAVWAHSAPGVLATQLAWDHDHCFGKPRLPAKVWTSSGDAMATWLENEGTASPVLPQGAAGLDMVGGRRCPILARRVGHVYYSSGDHRLSVYVVPGWVRLDRTRQDRRGDKTVRLLRVGGATVGIVSEEPGAVDAFERALTTTLVYLPVGSVEAAE
jgi:anti-sigma factor RsiW